jgi:D-methionine transport system ATP-binding protein
MIELKEIHKTYPNKNGMDIVALQNVNLQIAEGEIYGVMGPSGAGKSSLIRCVNLLERPSSGQVIVDGVDLTTLDAATLRKARRNMGMIFQHFNLLSSRTVAGNIALPLELSGFSRKEIKQRVDQLCDLTGLATRKNAYPDELSGGQKQRVAIARALSTSPKILLSDEATSSLDPETTRSILELLRGINRELKLTILLITHQMEVIQRICDRACILDHGRIVEEAPVLELFSRPQTPLAKKFVLSSLRVDLPEALHKQLLPQPHDQAVPLVRLTFVGQKAGEPIMVSLHKKFNVTPNILQAQLNWVHDSSIGVSICELLGQREAIVQGIQFIQSEGIDVEILGYVNPSATVNS